MRSNIMTTAADLRNWIDGATSDWLARNAGEIDTITTVIQAMDHPRWGADWTEFLATLPDLVDLVVTCPACGEHNRDVLVDGATDGPREYHAECWRAASATMSDEQIKAAWAASPLGS